ncbi:DUF4097 family beta strand repeat-containing protein [Lachnospiraceae bacterium 54-53]
MKRFIKVCLIAGSVCILIGGCISVTAAAMGGTLEEVVPRRAVEWKKELSGLSLDGSWEDFDFYVGSYEDMGERGQEIFSSGEIEELDIEARGGKVVLEEDPSADRVRIFCNRDETHWSVNGDKDELELKVYPGSGDDSGLLVTILVPVDYRFTGVNIKSAHTGRIRDREAPAPLIMAQSLSADEMELEAKAGAIKIDGGNAETLVIASDAGAVDFSGTTTGDIEAECRVGAVRLKLDGLKEDYNYKIRCSLGAVKIGDESSAALKSSKKVDNGAGKNMDLECITGAIQVGFMNDI